MTPNFALSLSFEGLRLLHRVQGGWHLVGEVALDVDDLGAALARLRAQALTIEPEGLHTKLLIPNEQIKYLALDTTRTELDDVRAALDGTTPYSVADLAVDFTKGGGRTYVAAVARETLDEAAAFASEHDFNPVCFAAVPEAFTFVGEAFFGALDGFDVSRDDDAVVVIGVADIAAVAPEAVAAPEPDAETTPEPKPTSDPDPTPEPDITPNDPSGMFEELALAASAPDETPPDDAPAQASEASDEPVFSARPRAPLAAPAKDAPTPDAPPVFAPARAVQPAADTRMDPPPLAVPQGKNTSPMPPLAGVKVDDSDVALAPVAALRADTPEPAAAPAVTGVAQTAVPDAEARHFETIVPVQAPKDDTPEQPETTDDTAPAPAPAPLAAPAPLSAPARAPDPEKADKPGLFRSRRKERAEKPGAADAPAQPDEKSRMTVFGARKPAKTKPKVVVGGKPRFLGLILTAVLLLFLIAVAAFAAIVSEDGLAGWFNRGTVETATTDPVADPDQPFDIDPASGVAGLDDSGDMGQGGTDVAVTPDAPEAAPVGQVLSPAEAQRIYAATGVWQRAPRIPLTPRTDNIDIVTVAATRPIERQQTPEIPDFSLAAQDGAYLAPVNPPAPGTDFPRDDRGFVLATPEGALTPDGIIVIAGRPPVLPPVRPGTVAPEVAAAPEVAPDVADTPEFASAAPSAPTLRPRTRPESAVADAPEAAPQDPATAGGVALTTLRPQTRPEGLAPVAAAAPEPDARLSGFRPRLRPAGLAPAPEPAPEPDPEVEVPTAPEPPTLEIAPEVAAAIAAAQTAQTAPAPSLIVNPTPQAITASLRPDTRPRNFARVVTRARENQARVAQQVAVVAPQTVAPSGPISGGVAQAATLEGALNLRDISLIGVFGTPDARRALVRMSNGRLVRVGVGDRLDGGRVQSIGDSSLNYTKRGRTVQLEMPSG